MGKGPTTPSVPGNGELYGRTPLSQFPGNPSLSNNGEVYGRTPVSQFPVNPSLSNTGQMLFGIGGSPTQPAVNSVGQSGPGGGALAPNSGTRPFPSSKGVSSQRQGDGFVYLDKPQAGGGFWDNFGSFYEASRQQRLLAEEEAKRKAEQDALLRQRRKEEEREQRNGSEK